MPTDYITPQESEELVPEGWTIQELEAPMGYALDETVYDLSVAPEVFTQASNTVEMSVCDDPIPGSITVLKADSAGKPLAGAVFLPEYSTDGTVVFTGLRADGFTQYRLTETKAPLGYSLIADTIYQGTLPTQGDSDPLYEIAFTVQDGVTTSLPMTGSNGNWMFPVLGLSVMALAGTVILILRKK